MASNNLTVSVALCAYNGDHFIEPQLESLLSQTRPPDEVIVCDDRSTDGTLRIARKVAANSPGKVRIIENERNLGYIKNFESAISRTTGDIIFLCDQDDYWLPDRVEKMLGPFSKSEKVGLVYCDAVLTDEVLHPTGRTVFGARGGMALESARSARQLVHGVDIGICGCMMAFRASLKPYVLPISPYWGHDHWIAFIAHAVFGVEVIDSPLVYYRRHRRNSGADPALDGGAWKGWLRPASSPEAATYAKETRRWEDMVERLRQLRSLAATADFPKLDEFILESKLRLEFARGRECLKRLPRQARIWPGIQLLFKGDYHFYVHGLRSFCKDLLMD